MKKAKITLSMPANIDREQLKKVAEQFSKEMSFPAEATEEGIVIEFPMENPSQQVLLKTGMLIGLIRGEQRCMEIFGDQG